MLKSVKPTDRYVKFLHTSITVKDMDSSISFYTQQLGMKLIRRREIPENNAEIAFVGYDESSPQLELTYWVNKKDYSEGDQLDHLAFEIQDMDTAIGGFSAAGVEIARQPFMLKGGSNRLAFIKDPNGIWIELIEK